MVQSAMLANMVQETVSVGGTGNITLGGASPGFNTFSDYFADGPGISYWIADGNDWETGIGHLTTGQTILVRDDILRRSVAGVVTDLPAAMNVSTSATVSVRPSAIMQPTSYRTKTSGSDFYNIPDNILNLAANFTSISNRLFLVSSYFLFPRKIAQLGIYVNAPDAAATNTRAGIYNVNPDGGPGNLVVDTGNIDISTAGQKMVPAASWVTGGPNPILLPAGHYYLATVSDSSTGQFKGLSTLSSLNWGGLLTPNSSHKRFSAIFYQDNITGALPVTSMSGGIVSISVMAIFKQA